MIISEVSDLRIIEKPLRVVENSRSFYIIRFANTSALSLRMWSVRQPRTLPFGQPNVHIIRCRGSKDYGWDLSYKRYSKDDRKIKEIGLTEIKRPLQGSRSNGTRNLTSTWSYFCNGSCTRHCSSDQEKVEALKESISEFGLYEPIDVLEVEGIYYGFSGCHRFQAHQELGKEKILCRVRKATKQTLKFHLMWFASNTLPVSQGSSYLDQDLVVGYPPVNSNSRIFCTEHGHVLNDEDLQRYFFFNHGNSNFRPHIESFFEVTFSGSSAWNNM